LVPILPAWIILEFLRFGIPIFDYRIVYLSAHAFWLSTWFSSSLIAQRSDFPARAFHSYLAYITVVTFCSLLSLLMPNIHFPKSLVNNLATFRKPLLLSFFGLCVISAALFATRELNSDYTMVLIVGPLMVLGAMLVLLKPMKSLRDAIFLV